MPEYFGEYIKKIRRLHNLTQSELAEKLNISYMTLCRYEKGKRLVPLKIQKRLSEIFNITISDSSEKNQKDNLLKKYRAKLIIIEHSYLYTECEAKNKMEAMSIFYQQFLNKNNSYFLAMTETNVEEVEEIK